MPSCRDSADGRANGSAPAAEPRSLVKFRHQQGFAAEGGQSGSKLSQALMRKKEAREVKPVYHPQCQPFALCWCRKLTRREAHEGHFGPHGMGASCYGRPGKSVVCDRSRRPSHQGEHWSYARERASLTADLGSGIRRAEAVFDGSYLDDPWLGGFGPTSVHVLMCRG